MTHSSGPWAHPPRKQSDHNGLLLGAIMLLLFLGTLVFIGSGFLNTQPWAVDRFASHHANHPKGY